MSAQVNAKRYIFLDYLRIFAFLTVFIGHTFATELQGIITNPQVHATPRYILELFYPFVIGGGAGVVVFFLISGYIISRVLYDDSSVQFLIKRIFRIYPLYVVAVLLQYALLKANTPTYVIDMKQLTIQLLLLGDFIQVPYALNGVEWTLRVEVLFYTFMALLRTISPNAWDTKWIFPLFVGIVVTCSLLPPTPNAVYLSNNYLWLYTPFLLVGAAFYLFETKRIGMIAWVTFVGLVLCLYWVGIAKHQPDWLGTHFGLLGVLLFGFVWGCRDYFKSHWMVLILSQLTYSVYLFHNWLFNYFEELSGSKLVATVLLFGACYVLYCLIEKPANHLGKVISKRWAALN